MREGALRLQIRPSRALFLCLFFLLAISVAMYGAGFLIIGDLYAADLPGYLTAGPSYISPDAGRSAESAVGLTLGAGVVVNNSFHLEFSGTGDTLQQKVGGQAYKQYGGRLDGLYFWGRSTSFSPYGVIGAGALQSEFANQKQTRLMVNGGMGVIAPLMSRRIFLRGDLRYRYDNGVDSLGRVQQDPFMDRIVHIQLVFPFGRKSAAGDYWPQPAPAPPPPPIPQDRDRDHVPDDQDRCPDTLLGARVNKEGCELDHDGDGVVNSQDRCPDSPLGVFVDAIGCPLTVMDDHDEDGVADAVDRCPSTKSGAVVGAESCEPVHETIGAVEKMTRCLESGANRGAAACDIPSVMVLQGVQFDPGSDRFLPGSETVLNAVAEFLRRNPDIVAEVAGYSDNVGPAALNIALSKKRAIAVSHYFILHGVLSANLIAHGYGSEKPIADNGTPKGRAINRRVELHILRR